ncbi:hypothetical protein Hanom_Chr07g00672241 [Helianthus anomalus]
MQISHSVVNNQKIGFYVPALTSSSSTQSTVLSQPTSVVDTVKVTPPNKPTVFPTFGMVKAPDAKPLGATSFINSTMNNDNGNSQKKPENLFGSSGSSSSAIPTTASANGVFSFGVSTLLLTGLLQVHRFLVVQDLTQVLQRDHPCSHFLQNCFRKLDSCLRNFAP